MADLTDISDPVYPGPGETMSAPAYPGPPASQPLTERYWEFYTRAKYDATQNYLIYIFV